MRGIRYIAGILLAALVLSQAGLFVGEGSVKVARAAEDPLGIGCQGPNNLLSFPTFTARQDGNGARLNFTFKHSQVANPTYQGNSVAVYVYWKKKGDSSFQRITSPLRAGGAADSGLTAVDDTAKLHAGQFKHEGLTAGTTYEYALRGVESNNGNPLDYCSQSTVPVVFASGGGTIDDVAEGIPPCPTKIRVTNTETKTARVPFAWEHAWPQGKTPFEVYYVAIVGGQQQETKFTEKKGEVVVWGTTEVTAKDVKINFLAYNKADPTKYSQGCDGNAIVVNGTMAGFHDVTYEDGTKQSFDGSDENLCGPDAGFDIVESLKQGMCGLAILGADINKSVLTSAAYILAKMVPLTGNKETVGEVDSANFFASLIPVEVEPHNIIDNLNNLPVVVGTVNLIIRLLGSFVIGFLIIVALANILQIEVNTYSIKKALPALVIGYLLAYGGVFATKAGIEFSNSITSYIMSPNLNGGQKPSVDTIVCNISTIGVGGLNGCIADPAARGITQQTLTTNNRVDMSKVMQQIFVNIFGLIIAVMMLILAFLFVIRAVIFIALTPLAPLAFFGITVDLFNPIWKRWWKTTQGWLFMNVVSSFWLWMMIQFFRLTNEAGGGNGTVGFFSGIVGYSLGVVCMYFAMTTPFKMAGEGKAILDKWNKVGKFAATPITAGANYLKNEAKDEMDMRWGRLKGGNNALAKGLAWRNEAIEERKKNVEMGKKGLNYKAMQRDAGKVGEIAENESALREVKNVIGVKEKDLEAAALARAQAEATLPAIEDNENLAAAAAAEVARYDAEISGIDSKIDSERQKYDRLQRLIDNPATSATNKANALAMQREVANRISDAERRKGALETRRSDASGRHDAARVAAEQGRKSLDDAVNAHEGAIKTMDLLQKRRDGLATRNEELESSLSGGTRANRANLEREALKGKRSDKHKANEELVRASSQHSLAYRSQEFQNLNGEVHDLGQVKSTVDLLGKIKSANDLSSGIINGKENDDLQWERQQRIARADALKTVESDGADKEKTEAQLATIARGLKDPSFNLTETDNQTVKQAGKSIGKYVEAEAGKDGKPIKEASSAIGMKMLTGDDVAGHLVNPDDYEKILDSLGAIGRVNKALRDSADISKEQAITGALDELANAVAGRSDLAEEVAEVQRALTFALTSDTIPTTSRQTHVKNVMNEFKKSSIGMHLNELVKNPDKVLTNGLKPKAGRLKSGDIKIKEKPQGNNATTV